jgi:uncharacterized protein
MSELEIRQDILDFAKGFIESHDPLGTKLKTRFPFRRLYEHGVRCAHWARRIALVEGADLEIAQISALLHDIGKSVDNTREGHARTGAGICDTFLGSIGFDPAKRARIVDIVRDHIHHARWHDASLEARIQSDADLLDEVGAMTVLWDAMDEGTRPDCSYETAYERIAGVCRNHQHDGNTSYHTETARRFVHARTRFLQHFVDNLAYELGHSELVDASWLSEEA